MFLAAVASLGGYAALVMIPNRGTGALAAQVLSAGGALVLLVVASDFGPSHLGTADRPLLPWGIGLVSAALAGLGYHLYMGRFTRKWAAWGAFLLVALGLAAALSGVFLALN